MILKENEFVFVFFSFCFFNFEKIKEIAKNLNKIKKFLI